MAKPINLMASLKDLGKNGKTKMAIRVEADDLLFDPDNKPLANAFAQAVVDQIKTNLMSGQAPDGKPLPPLAQSSIRSREYEVELGNRGGAASDHFVDPKFRAQVQKNYTRDYTASRLGQFQPRDGKLRGVLSGMLAASFFARPDKSGRGVTVYVAAKRGRPRPGKDRPAEAQSALESTFGTAPLMTQALADSAPIRKASVK